MTRLYVLLACFGALSIAAGPVLAQTTTGTITGRVIDSQDLPVPGVTITVAGPALQGLQTTVSSGNGDYILPLLPPGTYVVTFELSGFQTQERTVTLAATQTLPLNVTIGVAAVEEVVVVVGQAADVLTRTAQVATNFKQDVIAALPTNRDISATLLMAPSVHPSGPSGNYTIAGAMSFESLYMVNGVTANENIRGQPFNLYIEDAIQETVVATDGVSAEYGRFSGGLVNVITKSGTNIFSGSFRGTLNNDNWRSLVVGNGNLASATAGETPKCNLVTGLGGTQIPDPNCFAGDAKVAKVVPTYEYVFGGPIVKNRLTFFNAGRFQDQQTARNTVNPVNTPYVAEDRRQRYEIKLTGSLTTNHRVEGSYQKEAVKQINHTFNTATSMDLASLYTRETPLTSYQFNYNGILTNSLFLEGRLSMRQFSFIGNGATTTDRINGTVLNDRVRGLVYWSPTLCGVCGDEERNNDNEYVKATYFKSTKNIGSHTVVLGFDTFNDKLLADNHQSGSDYQIFGTTSIVRSADADCSVSPGCIFPQFLANGSTVLRYTPIFLGSRGTNFRTNALFANDSVRWNAHLTFNVGLRWDKHDGVDSAGNTVARDSKLAPRLGVVWDPKGDGVSVITASYGIYTPALATTIANSSSAGGSPAVILWAYTGPAINSNLNAPTANLVGPAAAIRQVFDWCAPDARGFCTSAAPVGSQVPGVSIRVGDNLRSPNVRAYAVGISRQLGNRGVVRADYSYRDYRDFYSRRVDRTTGIAVDELGNRSDVAIVENTSDLKRRYSGITLSGTYRVSSRVNLGANYTLSRLWGNFDGESFASGPLAADLFAYPEYRQQAWYAPEGDLSADQRHRSTLWIISEVPQVNGLTVSVIQHLASGVPYGASGSVDARPFVTNPGYVTPQGTPSQIYYYTARDAFRTEISRRTDLAVNYNRPFGSGSRRLEAFVQAQVINLFNHQDLCACGGTVFSNGGGIALNTIGASVLTPVTNAATFARFNPFTETPVQGVNWNYGANFGTPLNRFAFTSPRMFRLTFGVRF